MPKSKLSPTPVTFGQRVNLDEVDAGETGGLVKADAKKALCIYGLIVQANPDNSEDKAAAKAQKETLESLGITCD